jgi:hypothetical protein
LNGPPVEGVVVAVVIVDVVAAVAAVAVAAVPEAIIMPTVHKHRQ